MNHPSHHYAPGDERCFYCGGIKSTSETDTLCRGAAYDEEPGDAEAVRKFFATQEPEE